MKSIIYEEKKSQYLENHPSWHIEDSQWKAKQIISLMNRNKLNPKSIVEIGCGAGEILNQLMQKIPDQEVAFFGYDIAPDLLPFWKERANERLKFYHKNLLEEECFFDLLLMIDVFEHVEDYFGFIRKSGMKARYKIYHIPLDISVSSILRNLPLTVRESVGHLHYFVKDTALATLKDCGQEIIDYTYTSGAIEANNRKLRTKILNIPRRILYNLNKDLAVRLFGGYSLLVLTE